MNNNKRKALADFFKTGSVKRLLPPKPRQYPIICFGLSNTHRNLIKEMNQTIEMGGSKSIIKALVEEWEQIDEKYQLFLTLVYNFLNENNNDLITYYGLLDDQINFINDLCESYKHRDVSKMKFEQKVSEIFDQIIKEGKK